jgi:hypothetical protein
MRVSRRKTVEVNGKLLIFHDYKGLSGEEYVKAIEENARDADHSSDIERLVLLDVTDSVVDRTVLNAFKRISTKGAARKTSKTAIVGVTGIQYVFVQVIIAFSKLNLRVFDTVEEAQAWLIGDGNDTGIVE